MQDEIHRLVGFVEGIERDRHEESFRRFAIRKREAAGNRRVIQTRDRRAVLREEIHRDQPEGAARAHHRDHGVGRGLVHEEVAGREIEHARRVQTLDNRERRVGQQTERGEIGGGRVAEHQAHGVIAEDRAVIEHGHKRRHRV